MIIDYSANMGAFEQRADGNNTLWTERTTERTMWKMRSLDWASLFYAAATRFVRKREERVCSYFPHPKNRSATELSFRAETNSFRFGNNYD